ncbi:hypothetical protein SAMN05421509_10437 [Chromohalobacter canadensis]|uniref:HhH-GPD domain-containing protein n=2 Tax=Chromohalobacter canadensis TaxID=141389 RepID=A0A285VPT5_9GAMM|nr:hypothetical protein SAMN05421509_10437 [Chromohalobacter canadensis]
MARKIANHAKGEGVLFAKKHLRPTYDHLGAVLADSVLQAGLNYTTVVRPRVMEILREKSHGHTISSLVSLIKRGETCGFMNWFHHEKVSRFEALVTFLQRRGIEDVQDLRVALASDEFCDAIQAVNGIGPKTVDYLACLVGVECIAVDRHIRTFAKAAGVENNDYHVLRASFCCAADLLSIPRREFDAWLWRRAAAPAQVQLALVV